MANLYLQAARALGQVLGTDENSAIEFYGQLQKLCPGHRIYFEDITKLLVTYPDLKSDRVRLAEKLIALSRPDIELGKKKPAEESSATRKQIENPPHASNKKPNASKSARKKSKKRRGELRVVRIPMVIYASGNTRASGKLRASMISDPQPCPHGVKTWFSCPLCRAEKLAKDKGDWTTD